jgi:hypothetical protein
MPPRVQYGMACLLIRNVVGCESCLAVWGKCAHENLMAHVEQSKALSHKAKPFAFLFKATKTSKTSK